MNLAVRLLEAETDLAAQMTSLYESLPGRISDPDQLDPRFLDQALLEPARDIMARSGKGLRAQLLEHCWQLAGGDREGPPELLPILIELLHSGSLVIDDIEDDSPTRRGDVTLHRRYGLPIALNTGNWLYFLPLALLSRSNLDPELRLAVFGDVSTAVLRCHQGQALDISVKVSEVRRHEIPALVEQATRLKTGSLMELAARMGARAATGDAARVDALGRFGMEFGIGLQMLDDWSGIANESRREKGVEDLRLRRPTWVWVWLAEMCDDVTFADLMRTLERVSTVWEAEQLSRRLLEQLGSAPRQRVSEHLAGAIDELAEALGDSPEIKRMRDETERLERAYG
jgi:geranylgeranyl pyrophosphate synthase